MTTQQLDPHGFRELPRLVTQVFVLQPTLFPLWAAPMTCPSSASVNSISPTGESSHVSDDKLVPPLASPVLNERTATIYDSSSRAKRALYSYGPFEPLTILK